MADAQGWTPVQETNGWTPVAEPSMMDRANQAGREFIGGVASKLNPLPGISEGTIDPFGMVSAAKAAYAAPVDTLLETFAHPYMALKRAKDAIEAGNIGEADAHIASALSPLGAMTEASQVKAATPGQRAEGLGELVGNGIAAYLGAKAPGVLQAAKTKAAAAASADTTGIVKDAVGIVSPRAAHVIGTGQRIASLADRILGRDAAPPPPAPAPGPPQPPPLNNTAFMPQSNAPIAAPQAPAPPAAGYMQQVPGVSGTAVPVAPTAPVNPAKVAFEAAQAKIQYLNQTAGQLVKGAKFADLPTGLQKVALEDFRINGPGGTVAPASAGLPPDIAQTLLDRTQAEVRANAEKPDSGSRGNSTKFSPSRAERQSTPSSATTAPAAGWKPESGDPVWKLLSPQQREVIARAKSPAAAFDAAKQLFQAMHE